MPASIPVPTARHGLALGEDLGVRADADFEVLAPGALFDQHLLEVLGFGGAGLQLGEIVADEAGDLGADGAGGVGVAAGAFLDDALQHGDGEGHAGGFDGLEVDGREEPGLVAVAALGRGVGEDGVERTEILAVGGAESGGRVGGLAKVAHRGEGGGDIVQIRAAEDHDGWAVPIRAPYAPGERGLPLPLGVILGQRRLQCLIQLRHGFPPAFGGPVYTRSLAGGARRREWGRPSSGSRPNAWSRGSTGWRTI